MYYDYNMAIREAADYAADMMEMAGEAYYPTDEEMEEMAKEYGEA